MIRSLASIMFVLIACNIASAQTFTGATAPMQTTGLFERPSVIRPNDARSTPSSVQSTTELKYYDASLGTYDWILGGNYGGIIALVIGERMTLPWTNGYVDSISIVIDSLHGDSLTIVLSPDTLYDVGNGVLFHLMDIFGQANSYGEVVLHRDQINFGGETIVKFDHAPVPKEFFVSVAADVNLAAGTIAPVWVRGDREAIRERTTEATRSAMVGLFNQQFYTLVLDSTFIVTGDNSVIFSNLYAKAFVTPDAGSVASASLESPALSIYPNPTSEVLHVHTTTGVATVTVYDQLGRTMLMRAFRSGDESIDVRSLPTGSYRAVLRDANGTSTTPMSIVR